MHGHLNVIPRNIIYLSILQSHAPSSGMNSWEVCSLIVTGFESRLNHSPDMRQEKIYFFNIFVSAPYLRKGLWPSEIL